MSKPAKVILGLATLWPPIYIFIFVCFWFYMMVVMIHERERGMALRDKGIPPEMVVFFVLHGITMLWMFALVAIYIYNVFNNDRVAKDKKALWAVVLFLGNAIAMPIYWYLYIWPENKPQPKALC